MDPATGSLQLPAAPAGAGRIAAGTGGARGPGQGGRGAYSSQFGGLSGSGSRQATDILRSAGLTPLTGEQDQVVFKARQGVNDPQVRAAVTGLLDRIRLPPGILAGMLGIRPTTAAR